MTDIERSITHEFRKGIWTPFLSAIKEYRLLSPGDRIAVCISGGKDSMLLAKLLQMLQPHSDVPFQLRFLAMDPGYAPANRLRLEENAQKLDIPLEIFTSDIFQSAEEAPRSPCYLCAKMRRGHLYKQAQAMGCNKIALGHHFSDVIETTVLAMFYGSQLQGMLPMLRSTNFQGMSLIRPLYGVHEDAICAWRDAHHLEFLQCACRITRENNIRQDGSSDSKRQEIKQLLRRLKQIHPAIEKCIFHSLHAVHLDTFPAFKTNGRYHSFLERYDATGIQTAPTDDTPAP